MQTPGDSTEINNYGHPDPCKLILLHPNMLFYSGGEAGVNRQRRNMRNVEKFVERNIIKCAYVVLVARLNRVSHIDP